MLAATSLRALLATLVEEEAALVELVTLAAREQQALVHSDYSAIETVSEEMATVAGQLERLERSREEQLTEAGMPGARFADLIHLATSLGVEGFGMARERLGARAAELRDIQEQNARLIISAAKLRQRWLNLLTGRASETYTAGGRQELTQGRRAVSKTA